jgi:tetratricopeptide (TPR) repeat protein
MQSIKKVIFLLVLGALVTAVAAQSQESPLSDTRLSIHTLVREDIFAGFMADDMERFSRGEKNIDLLLEKRPNEKADLMAWKGGVALYRTVRAQEAGRADEVEKYYKQALDYFAQARQINPQSGGAIAVTGGSYLFLGDRLPEKYRAAAWTQAYESYQMLWKYQGSSVERLPVHLRGELLGGLAQAAQRTGHTQEFEQTLDKILAVMGGTPYESVARKWKENPKSAASGSITCMTCHDAGRLNARITSLKDK